MKVNECPGCGQTEYKSYGGGNEFPEYAGGKTFIQQAYTIQKCISCGLYFKDNIIDESLLNDYYNSFDFTAWNPVESYPTENIVKEYLLSIPSARVLDYGCSQGRFISSYVDKHECYGFDIDLRALEIASKKGVLTLTESELNNTQIKFDVIILSDVFEHSLHPTQLLQKLSELLGDKGVLIIITGYADAKASQYDLPNYWYFKTIQHVCMMGEDYIQHLKKRLNKQIMKKIICSHYQVDLKKKLVYQLRFSIFRYVNTHRDSILIKWAGKLPYLKKVTQWKDQPYFPYSKDHVVLFLKNA